MAYAPTIIPFTNAAPAPRAEVLFTTFAPGTATVTVYRLAEGREYQVRGAVNAAVAGSLSRIDSEVPFGVPATYRAEMFDAAGMSLGFTDSGAVTLNVAETWVHNPLDPTGAVKVVFLQGSAKSIRRPSAGKVFYPEGRTVGVVISGARSGVTGIPLPVMTETFADADKIQAMLGGYGGRTVPVLCFRTPPPMRIPRPFFVAVMDAAETDIAVSAGDEALSWEIEGDEVAPPAPGLFVPLLTNADINAFYATNAALNAGNLTNLDVNRRYELANSGSGSVPPVVEDPAGSGLYTTTGMTETPAGSGLYSTDGFTENPAGSGLYNIGAA